MSSALWWHHFPPAATQSMVKTLSGALVRPDLVKGGHAASAFIPAGRGESSVNNDHANQPKVLFVRASVDAKQTQAHVKNRWSQRLHQVHTAATRVKETFRNALGRITGQLDILNVRSPYHPRVSVSKENDSKNHPVERNTDGGISYGDFKPVGDPKKAKEANQKLIDTLAKMDGKTDLEMAAMRKGLAKEVAVMFFEKPASFSFESIHRERFSGPTGAAICAKYLQLIEIDNPELSSFMRAMDDLRSASTIEKIEVMLKDYIMPEPFDNFDAVQLGKMTTQLNLTETSRNNYIKTIRDGLLEIKADNQPDKIGKLVKIFEDVEQKIFVSIRANEAKFTALIANEFHRTHPHLSDRDWLDPKMKV